MYSKPSLTHVEKTQIFIRSTILYHTQQRTGKLPGVTHHWENSVLGHVKLPSLHITRRTAAGDSGGGMSTLSRPVHSSSARRQPA